MFGKPTNVVQEDLSKYAVDIQAAPRFLSLLTQQFVEKGYCPEKIRPQETRMENVISVRRHLPNQKTDGARFVVGNYARICKMFGLKPLSEKKE